MQRKIMETVSKLRVGLAGFQVNNNAHLLQRSVKVKGQPTELFLHIDHAHSHGAISRPRLLHTNTRKKCHLVERLPSSKRQRPRLTSGVQFTLLSSRGSVLVPAALCFGPPAAANDGRRRR